MMLRLILALVAYVVLMLSCAPAYAQNPCAATDPGPVLNPTEALFDAPLAGVTSMTLSIFRVGSNPATSAPVASLSVPRSAFVLVTANCYRVPLGALLLPLTPGAEYIAAGRFVTAQGSGAWVPSVNTFAVVGCAPRANEARAGLMRVVRETVSATTRLAQRVAELSAAGWTIVGFTGTATVIASCEGVP